MLCLNFYSILFLLCVIAAVKEFMDAHCTRRHYFFSVIKCNEPDCKGHKSPRLPPDVFSDLHTLPDPMMAEDRIHYQPFSEVYGRPTVEAQRPSLKSKANSAVSHGMPFSPSAQTVCRVRMVVTCQECDKPRVLHGAKKLKKDECIELEKALEQIDFTCGTTMACLVPDDAEEHILEKVYVRADLKCIQPVEVPYFSSGIFPALCCHCATESELVTGQPSVYPACHTCYSNKPKVLKRKRKIFPEPEGH